MTNKNASYIEPKLEKPISHSNIPYENLRLMLDPEYSRNSGNLASLLLHESFGRTQVEKSGKKYPVGAANFFYDGKTGKIVFFGNWQDVPKNIRQNFNEGMLILALMSSLNERPRVGILSYHIARDTSPEAKSNLEETIRMYNIINNWRNNEK